MAAILNTARAGEPPFWRPHFRPGDARSLSLFRFLYCAGLYISLLQMRDRDTALHKAGQYNPIPLFERWGIPFFSAAQFGFLYYGLMILLICGAAGWLCRYVFPAAATFYFLYMGTVLGVTKTPFNDYVSHSSNIVFFILLILGLSEKIGVWGIDGLRKRNLRWRLSDPAGASVSPLPLLAVKAALALAYFGSGYCKMASDPLWADGETLQAYLIAKYLIVDTEYGFWLAQSWALCLFFGAMTLWIELTFGLILFFPKTEWIYIVSGLGMHAAILFTMKINFFLYFGLTYLVFLDWPRFMWILHQIDRPLRRLRGDPPAAFDRVAATPPPPPPPPSSRIPFGRRPAGHYAIFAMLIVLLSNIVMRVESWPFTDYRVFEKRLKFNQVMVYRLAGVDASGKYRWLTRRETAINAVAINARARRLWAARDAGAIANMLKGIADAMPPVPRSDFKKLVLIRRQIRVLENGDFAPVDKNFMEFIM